MNIQPLQEEDEQRRGGGRGSPPPLPLIGPAAAMVTPLIDS